MRPSPMPKQAGATVAEVYQTEAFDGRLVQPLVNAVVARESLRSGADHVWWMLLDSDEVPGGSRWHDRAGVPGGSGPAFPHWWGHAS